MVADLRKRLTDLENRYLTEYHVDVSMIAGAGAAGGLAGALTILGGTLVPGFALIADTLGLDDALRDADLVITGEGRLDAGSFDGKVVGGVAARARALGVPIVAVVGEQTDPAPADITVLSLVELFGRAAALEDTLQCIESAVRKHLSTLNEALHGPRCLSGIGQQQHQPAQHRQRNAPANRRGVSSC